MRSAGGFMRSARCRNPGTSSNCPRGRSPRPQRRARPRHRRARRPHVHLQLEDRQMGRLRRRDGRVGHAGGEVIGRYSSTNPNFLLDGATGAGLRSGGPSHLAASTEDAHARPDRLRGGPLGPTPRLPPRHPATYAEAKARAGRSPDDQIKLALWCEAHGLTAERLHHLTPRRPGRSEARDRPAALLGLVAHDGPVAPARGRRRQGRGRRGTPGL